MKWPIVKRWGQTCLFRHVYGGQRGPEQACGKAFVSHLRSLPVAIVEVESGPRRGWGCGAGVFARRTMGELTRRDARHHSSGVTPNPVTPRLA